MRVVTFGEVMIRLAPEELLRVRQVLPGRFEATFFRERLLDLVAADLGLDPVAVSYTHLTLPTKA